MGKIAADAGDFEGLISNEIITSRPQNARLAMRLICRCGNAHRPWTWREARGCYSSAFVLCLCASCSDVTGSVDVKVLDFPVVSNFAALGTSTRRNFSEEKL